MFLLVRNCISVSDSVPSGQYVVVYTLTEEIQVRNSNSKRTCHMYAAVSEAGPFGRIIILFKNVICIISPAGLDLFLVFMLGKNTNPGPNIFFATCPLTFPFLMACRFIILCYLWLSSVSYLLRLYYLLKSLKLPLLPLLPICHQRVRTSLPWLI